MTIVFWPSVMEQMRTVLITGWLKTHGELDGEKMDSLESKEIPPQDLECVELLMREVMC